MNKEKLTYLSPETETLVVRFEDSILQVASPGQNQNVEESQEFGGIGGWV